MTQLDEAHFELHSANKDRIFQKKNKKHNPPQLLPFLRQNNKNGIDEKFLITKKY